MNHDEKDFTFEVTYGDESTGYHRNMISGVVFFYSNTLKSMLVDHLVTEIVCFDDYSNFNPRDKNMRVNGITTFLLHVAQCITFLQTKFVTATIIAEALLKSFYPRLGFKVIKYLATSHNFEEAHKRFHYESGKYKVFQKQTIGLQCHLTILQRFTILHGNKIYLN